MKLKRLLVLLILIAVWSLFFAIFKYFTWGVFKTPIITLQYISGFVSLGSVFAYVFGGFLYEIARERKFHTGVMLFSLATFGMVWLLNPLNPHFSLMIAMISLGVGCFYGLWNVLKNVLISTYIHETNMPDTRVNGFANICFITSIIVGSIFGGMIAEKFSIAGVGIGIVLLLFGLVVGLSLTNTQGHGKNVSEIMTRYRETFLAEFLYIVQHYFVIMFFAAILLAIGTILSQKAIEYAVEFLDKTGSQAAFLLLYSAFGSIVGNVLSMRITQHRWFWFAIYGLGFALSACIFPSFVDNFFFASVILTIAGFFFGVSFNLIEAYFFKKIADDDKKSFGAASIGIVMSGTISGSMFVVDGVQRLTSFAGVYYFMSLELLFVALYMYFRKDHFIP